MKLKFDTTLDWFIVFIVLIKIIFVISAVSHIFMSHAHNQKLKDDVDPKLVVLKERTEFVFIISMSILLIYHFIPGKNKVVTEESALLFFLFGIVLLITAKWSLFITEAPWYKRIIQSLQ
jgi:hypothetical protein